jgi:hypothetical protein
MGILIFKGLAVRLLFKLFGVKGLSWHRCCGWTCQMNSGRLIPETATLRISFAAWCRTGPHSNHTDQLLFHSTLTRCSSDKTQGAEQPKQIRKRGRIPSSFASLLMRNESLNSCVYRIVRTGLLTCVTITGVTQEGNNRMAIQIN